MSGTDEPAGRPPAPPPVPPPVPPPPPPPVTPPPPATPPTPPGGEGGDATFGRRALLVGAGAVGGAAVLGGVVFLLSGDDEGPGDAEPTDDSSDPGDAEPTDDASDPYATTGSDDPGATTASGDESSATATATASEEDDTEAPSEAGDDEVRIINWPEYIDPTVDGQPGTTDRFADATGIAVDYSETLTDNETLYTREVVPYLGAGEPTPWDVMNPTEWMAARIASDGWLEPLPLDRIPNRVNVDARYYGRTWDPDLELHLPWLGAMTGIAYNPELTGRELRSVMDLFDPEFAGRIGFLSEMREAVGLTMLGLGYDPADPDEAAAMEAIDVIDAAVADGQIRRFTTSDYLMDLESGDMVACMAWSVDIAQVASGIEFVIPDEGGMLWYDAMVIPAMSPNAAAAAEWINFVYDPVQAARLMAYVQFMSPVNGVRGELLKMGGDGAALAANELLFPDAATLDRLSVFGTLPSDVDARLSARWAEVTGG